MFQFIAVVVLLVVLTIVVLAFTGNPAAQGAVNTAVSCAQKAANLNFTCPGK